MAGTNNPPPASVPAVSNIDVGLMYEGIRAALVCGSEFLLGQMSTNEPCYVPPPHPYNDRNADSVEVTVRYSKRIVEEPVYESKWETYETVETRKGASRTEPDRMVKVTKRRLVSRVQTGTRSVERLVRDPQGPIVEKQRKGIGAVMGDEWYAGFLGQNAMAVAALLKAGVPASHPSVSQLASRLSALVCQYGAPDLTWDLAWLTVAFASLEGREYENALDICVNRLLDGQITDGAARGLWGPVCINTRLLAAAMLSVRTLEEDISKAKQKLQKRPDSKQLQRGVEEAESRMTVMPEVYRGISQQGLRLLKVLTPYKLEDAEIYYGRPVLTQGLPYFFYDQTIADMESTALALYALRMASEAGRLPEKIRRPMVASKPLIPPDASTAVLARAANALAARQQKTGAWDDALIAEPGKLFGGFNISMPGPSALPVFTRRTSSLSTAQGFGALINAGHAVGMEKLKLRFRDKLVQGQSAQAAAAAAYLAGDSEQTNGPALRGSTFPCDLLFHLAVLRQDAGGTANSGEAAWLRLAYRALVLQAADGSWGGGRGFLFSPGAWEALHARLGSQHEAAQRALPVEKRKPYDPAVINRHHKPIDFRIPATCYAMLALSEWGRPPVAAGRADEKQTKVAEPDYSAQTAEGANPFERRAQVLRRLGASGAPAASAPAAPSPARPVADEEVEPPAEKANPEPVVSPAVDEVW